MLCLFSMRGRLRRDLARLWQRADMPKGGTRLALVGRMVLLTAGILLGMLIKGASILQPSRGALRQLAEVDAGSSHLLVPHQIDCVLAVSLGIPLEMLAVFVQSWKRWSPETRLTVFVNASELQEQPDIAALYARFDVDAVPFELPDGFTVHVYRFELYKTYLEAHQMELRGVVLSDIKDVVLQSDPWLHPEVARLVQEDAMLFSLEGGPLLGDVSIAEERHNANWVQKCFGQDALERLGNNTISCSGVSVGSAGAVRAYVQQMQQTLAHGVRSGCADTVGADQGVHNYLLHELGPRGQLPFKFRALPNLESPVYTLALGFPVRLDRYHQIEMAGRARPAVLHQYNRHKQLVELYTQMYPYPLPEEEVELTFQSGGVRGYTGSKLPAEYNYEVLHKPRANDA